MTLAALPSGARVGTSSLRRACQLRALRPELTLVDLRGNVDTRLRKLREGQYDAIVLAAAGLKRLGLDGAISELIEPDVLIPAVGQGVIGVEARADDEEVLPSLHRWTIRRRVSPSPPNAHFWRALAAGVRCRWERWRISKATSCCCAG